MKVVFLEDVPGTADAGEVREVRNGFARNYLIPRNLATPATANALQRIRSIENTARDKRTRFSQDATVIARSVEGRQLVIYVRVGPTGRLFGSVTGRHIAQELNRTMGLHLDHRAVLLGHAIHELGDYEVVVRVYRDVTALVRLSVVPEGTSVQDSPGIPPDAEEPQSNDVVDLSDSGFGEGA